MTSTAQAMTAFPLQICRTDAGVGYVDRMRDRLLMSNLETIQLFVSVVNLGSVSRAASVHGIAQPSASERLKNFERELGIPLLTRSPRGSQPTELGATIAALAAPLLIAAERFSSKVEGFRAVQLGQLRVAASPTCAEFLLPSALCQVVEESPQVSPQVTVLNSSEVLAALRSGTAELGFVESSAIPSDFLSVTVERDEIAVIAPTRHSWASRRKPITVAELAATRLVTREVGSGTRRFFEDALRQQGVEPSNPLLELGSTGAIAAAVAEGIAPGVLGKRAAENSPHAEAIRVVAVENLPLSRWLRATWLSEVELPPAAHRLLDVLGVAAPTR